jgi:hypothetical protein
LTLAALPEPGWSAPAPQQTGTEPVRTAEVTGTGDEIVVDGSLDESAWRQAPTIGNLVQRIPNAGAEPTERTVVKLLHDLDNLYVGVMCYDSEPERILASQMARDASLNSDDRISILFDTFRDQSNAFYFSTAWSSPTARPTRIGTRSGSSRRRERTKVGAPSSRFPLRA